MKNSSLKSTINRANIKESILRTLKNMKKPISTAEIAQILDMSWHTSLDTV